MFVFDFVLLDFVYLGLFCIWVTCFDVFWV